MASEHLTRLTPPCPISIPQYRKWMWKPGIGSTFKAKKNTKNTKVFWKKHGSSFRQSATIRKIICAGGWVCWTICSTITKHPLNSSGKEIWALMTLTMSCNTVVSLSEIPLPTIMAICPTIWSRMPVRFRGSGSSNGSCRPVLWGCW